MSSSNKSSLPFILFLISNYLYFCFSLYWCMFSSKLCTKCALLILALLRRNLLKSGYYAHIVKNLSASILQTSNFSSLKVFFDFLLFFVFQAIRSQFETMPNSIWQSPNQLPSQRSITLIFKASWSSLSQYCPIISARPWQKKQTLSIGCPILMIQSPTLYMVESKEIITFVTKLVGAFIFST